MIYSVLYGHLSEVYVKKGDKLVYGNKIGKMGNTGYVIPAPTKENPTAGTHLHLSVVEGKKTYTWTLASMKNENKPDKQQCLYFLQDNDIFDKKDEVKITCGWLGYKNHYAYDIVPKNYSYYDIHWNRSFTGTVSATGYNSGYGNFVVIQYDTTKKTANEAPKSDENIDGYKNTIEELRSENGALNAEIERIKGEKEQLLINNQNYEVKINELTKEKQILQDKIKLLELDKPKLIFNCEKKGMYKIYLKENYKLYIKK